MLGCELGRLPGTFAKNDMGFVDRTGVNHHDL